MQVPSLPFLSSASLPEVIWVITSALATGIAFKAYCHDTPPAVRLKNGIRTWAGAVYLMCGLFAMFSGPPSNPSWLSVLTPMTIAFGVTASALLSVIDEQVKEIQ